MNRGGVRKGSGRKSPWLSSPGDTTTLRVPKGIADEVKNFAAQLDRKIARKNLQSQEKSVPSVSAQLSLKIEEDATPAFEEVEFLGMARKMGIEGLYYITHISNLPSILAQGILSHDLIARMDLEHEAIYNSGVIQRRKDRDVVPGRSLWTFANLYFQPRNPMLYSVIHNFGINEVAIICVKKTIMNREDIFITNGNAASGDTEIFKMSESKPLLSKIIKQVDIDWWNQEDGTKRKIMAECLVSQKVSPCHIQSIYVANSRAKKKVESLLLENYPSIPIVEQSTKFFDPERCFRVASNISLVKGDMFFSRMQTLTISVNCVGIMGKGLASTARDRFPDVYVHYQALCKQRKLRLGKPCVYKRESSVLESLGDSSVLMAPDESDLTQTWFLLFPTKDHWKNNSTIESVEEGLKWFCDNYAAQNITSVAFPALGCGNGNLGWEEVGPLMCQYLSRIGIPVSIYLPAEVDTNPAWLTSDFLLSRA
jgi:O-acetyl-ADP-ribose deacetylase (regulator of RNase III)